MDEDHELDSSSNDEEDSTVNIAGVMQLLLRSGQLRFMRHLLTADEEEDISDRNAQMPLKPPDSSCLEGGDLEQLVLSDCGGASSVDNFEASVPIQLEKRRRCGAGSTFHNDASHLQRRLAATYLPNRKLRTLASFPQKLFCGIFSYSGDVFLSACQDQKIRIFDTSRGQFKQQRTVHARDVGWSVLDLALSPDAHHIVYSTWSPNLQMFSLASELHYELPLNPAHDRFCVFSLAFSRNGAEVLGGANHGDLYFYDLERHQRTLRVAGAHEDDLNAVAFADDSSQIFFSGGDDGLLKCWDRRTLGRGECESGEPVGVFAGHHDGITFVDSKGDGRYVISNSKDQSIKLWDTRKFASKHTQEASCQRVARQGWDYRWQAVPRRMRRQLDTISGDPSLMTYRGHEVRYTLMRARFSPQSTTGQRYIYAGSAEVNSSCVMIWDVLSGAVVRHVRAHRNCVRDVSWHPWELQRLVTSSWDGTHVELVYEEKAAAEELAERQRAEMDVLEQDSDEETFRTSAARRLLDAMN